RAEQSTTNEKTIANFVAYNFGISFNGIRFGLHSVNFIHRTLGTSNMEAFTKNMRDLSKNKL
ncbi:hypothetical protein ACN9K5_10835, partial [Aliarcobacter butzleri]|uniref:hypothetical protein n=1 Tax=Aliarcobacter butzleri TaxID=28197 RepID=UPI003B227A3C